jgi:hypothetical protein
MVRGEIVKRSWSKKSQISEHTELLDIWDTGSHIFERWPSGDEYYWKVISREEFNTGFIEILEKMPIWQVPGEVLYRQQIPLIRETASHFQMGGWSVEQEVEKASSNEMEDSAQAQRQREHRPHAHTYKKNTSLQRPQQKPQGQQKPQDQGKPLVQLA